MPNKTTTKLRPAGIRRATPVAVLGAHARLASNDEPDGLSPADAFHQARDEQALRQQVQYERHVTGRTGGLY